jgi:hypothetical protein
MPLEISIPIKVDLVWTVGAVFQPKAILSREKRK